MRESTLQAAIIRALEARGAYVVNVVVAGRKGSPDLLVIYRGFGIALEVKLPTGRLTPLQRVELARVEAAYGLAAVVRSVPEALAVLDECGPRRYEQIAVATSPLLAGER